MDESKLTPPDEAMEAARESESLTHAEALDLNEIQALDPAEFEALCHRLNFRPQLGRSHHQHILDLLRYALARGTTVTAEGFLDQTSESTALLRWPRLNFLPVPEDVFVPRAIV